MDTRENADLTETLEALEQTVRVAKSIPADRFDMSDWGKSTDCGTIFCLFGWCCQDAWFQEKFGLRLAQSDVVEGALYPEISEGLDLEFDYESGGWFAVYRVYKGLSRHTLKRLFSPHDNPRLNTLDGVISRLQATIDSIKANGKDVS